MEELKRFTAAVLMLLFALFSISGCDVMSLRKNERLWGELMQCKTAEQCGRRIGTLYDGNDEAGAELIACAAKQYYKRFHSEKSFQIPLDTTPIVVYNQNA